MSQIDKANAVTQESLEPVNNAPQWDIVGGDGINPEEGNRVEPVEPEAVETVVENETVEEDSPIEDGVAELIEDAPTAQEQEEVQPEAEAQEPTVEEDIIDIDLTAEEPIQDTVEEPKAEGDLPDWVQKLVDFTNETGGGLEEYMNYTKDFESLSDTQLLKEYYALTKPSYTPEDIDLLIDTKFGVSELEEGQEMSKEDKLKLLSLKDEVLNAKDFLNKNKDKYYADLKSGVLGAPEQYKEAVEHFNAFKEQSIKQEAVRETFIADSQKAFGDNFDGFHFEGGGKKYRMKVGNGQSVMESQLDLNNVISQFVNDDGSIGDVMGWHKALWAAQNADKIFNAGLEAGKALLAKERAAATKNPSYEAKGQSKAPEGKPKYRFLGSQDNNNF